MFPAPINYRNEVGTAYSFLVYGADVVKPSAVFL
jgi:hypothetical protein